MLTRKKLTKVINKITNKNGRKTAFEEIVIKVGEQSGSSSNEASLPKKRRVDSIEFKEIHNLTTNNDNVCYVLVGNLDEFYNVRQNHCVRIKLLNFSNKFILQVDGYQVANNETFAISTFFDHRCWVKFVKAVKQTYSTTDLQADIEKFSQEYGENYFNFMKTYEKLLNSGKMLLLRVETDMPATLRHYRVLAYLDYSTNNLESENLLHERIENDFKPKLALEKAFFEKSAPQHVDLYEHMKTIHKEISIRPNDRVLVVGSKNSGKSSLIHYLMNREISKSKDSDVYYLGCDPGQTEFGPQGVLSLSRVDSYKSTLSGSKFFLENHDGFLTNPSKHLFSKVLGVNNVAEHLEEYTTALECLYEKFNNLGVNSPLFINSMGWIIEDGFKIIQFLIKTMRPTIVIYLADKYRNQLPSEESAIRLPIEECLRTLCPRFYHFDICCRHDFKSSPYKRSAFQRLITQISYATASLSPEINITSFSRIRTSIRLSLNDVIIHHVSKEEILPCMVYDLLNFSWVYLGTVPTDEHRSYISNPVSSPTEEKPTEDLQTKKATQQKSPGNFVYTNVLPSGAEVVCCGFIQSISAQNNQITLNTSVQLTKQQIEAINLVVIGDGIPTPAGFIFEDVSKHRHSIPYYGRIVKSQLPKEFDSKLSTFRNMLDQTIHIPEFRREIFTKIYPDFDPNKPPAPPVSAPTDSPSKKSSNGNKKNKDDDGIIIL